MSTAAPLTAVPDDPAIARAVAGLLTDRNVDRFNARICPGSHDIAPVRRFGPAFAGAKVAGYGDVFIPDRGDEKAAVLAIGQSTELVFSLGVDFGANDWCLYTAD